MRRQTHHPNCPLLCRRLIAVLLSIYYPLLPAAQVQLPEPILFPTTAFERIDRIAQDTRGFVWLATNRGLFCFDGTFYRKITHQAEQVSPIDNGQIKSFYLDQERERLWLGTPFGVSVLDLPTETFSDYEISHPQVLDRNCTALAQDHRDRIWLALEGFGLASFDTSFHFFPMPRRTVAGRENAVPSIYKIAPDVRQDSILWLATGFTGLVRFSTQTGEYVVPDQRLIAELPGGIIFTNLYPTPEKIYLGSVWSHNSYIYDLTDHTFHQLENDNPNYPRDIIKLGVMQACSPTTIFGSNSRGIFLFDQTRDSLLKRFDKPAYIASFHDLLATPLGLWVGSEQGLLWYDLAAYRVENHTFPADESGKPHHLSTVLEKDDGSSWWVGFQTSDYLYNYDRGTRSFHRLAVPTPGTSAPSILIQSPDGRIIALAQKDIYELRNDQLVYLPEFRELIDSKVSLGSPQFDQSGNLWMGSRWGGLYKMDLATGQAIDCSEGMDFRGVHHIFLDRDDNIWGAPIGGGGFFIYRQREGTVLRFPYRSDTRKTIYLPEDFIQDAAGQIWASDTRVGGLLRLDPDDVESGVQERYVGRPGHYNHQMYSLQLDDKGRIWAVTKEGLQVFDPKEQTFKLFGSSVGFRLRGKDRSTSNFIPTYLTRLSTGELLVGYQDGFAVFHPDSLLAIREQARPYLLSLRIHEQIIRGITLDNTKEIRLKHNAHSPEFIYSALSRGGWGRPRFAYRLRGLSDQWVETDQRSIRYAQLTPGSYTFQIHTVSTEGSKMGDPLLIRFVILPPWWKRWWAYSSYLLIVAGLLWLTYQWRKRRWELQAQLTQEHREAERLKELDQFKNKLFTNISHEFRTPITVILGMVEQIKAQPKKWSNKGLVMIKRNADNLLRLVNQMLDLSKLEAGVLPVSLIQGDVIAYLRYISESFMSLAMGKEITLQFHSAHPMLVMDYDPEKLRAILSNLLSNAIKFTPAGGQVQCLVDRIESERQGKDQLSLRISDTGKGIAAEKLPHIFDRFYSDDDGEGAGIGLALTRELVKLLHGDIVVSSRIGEGSEFIVTLPIHQEAILEQPPESLMKASSGRPAGAASITENSLPASPGTNRDKPLLLLIEDSPDVVRYLMACLQESYRLLVATNGKEGLATALAKIPDIIISDVMMPEMDGFTLCQKLKADFRTSHIPIILLTARVDMASKIEGLKKGADAYLVKPFHKQELLVRLQKMLELRKRLQERYASIMAGRAEKQPGEADSFHLEDTFMQGVRKILEAHLDDEHFGIPDLCRELGMSRSQLYRKFKALTDQPIGQYFRLLRLHQAMDLLQTTEQNVSEIAYAVGFKDPAYFTNSFKEAFGITPSEVRK